MSDGYLHFVLMSRRASYRIDESPDGRFTITVTLANGGTHSREGLSGPAEVEEALSLLRDLMTACGVCLVEEPALGLAAE